MNVSVVIPAFNEARVLPATFGLLDAFLDGSGAGLLEIIVVDDGSTDGTAAAALAGARGELRLLRQEKNRGKGAAVRAGVLETSGDAVIVTDADGNYLHGRAAPFVEAIRSGEDVVLASRSCPGSRWEVGPCAAAYIRRRRAMGRVFNGIVRTLTGLDVRDTQTGLKFFRGDVARDLFEDLVVQGFAYDVEVLLRAHRRGFSIRELPFVYCCPSAESKVTFWDPFRMLADVLRIPRLCRSEGRTE